MENHDLIDVLETAIERVIGLGQEVQAAGQITPEYEREISNGVKAVACIMMALGDDILTAFKALCCLKEPGMTPQILDATHTLLTIKMRQTPDVDLLEGLVELGYLARGTAPEPTPTAPSSDTVQ